jgi:folylpolyglutamate synthase/dihydropteroate synthase
LKSLKPTGKTLALFGIMADKSIEDVIMPLLDCIDIWFTVTFKAEPRAISAQHLAAKVRASGGTSVQAFEGLEIAWSQFLQQKRELSVNRVVVFGSFLGVSGMLDILEKQNDG